MEKRVYFLKFNKKILIIDLFSVFFGFVGVILGIISLLALEPFWNNDKTSMIITIIAIFFDTASFCLAFSAFFMMYRLVKIKKNMIKQNMKLYRQDWISIWCDFNSFFFGLVGTICEIISIIVLIPNIRNEIVSYNITVAAVIFDIVSMLIAIVATMLTIRIIKNYRLRGNSII